jgi:hypothetical protein
MIKTMEIPKTLVFNSKLTLLIAPEDVNPFIRYEIFKSFVFLKRFTQQKYSSLGLSCIQHMNAAAR